MDGRRSSPPEEQYLDRPRVRTQSHSSHISSLTTKNPPCGTKIARVGDLFLFTHLLVEVSAFIELRGPYLFRLRGVDRELRKSGDATHLATDGPAPRHYDGGTAAARVRAAVFVRSEKSNALVGDGVPQPAPRSVNLDSAFGGMQLFVTEAWRAAPLLLTHSAQLTQPTVRLPQL